MPRARQNLDIPTIIDPESPRFRESLQRLALALFEWVRTAADRFTPIEVVLAEPNPTAASFGTTIRIELEENEEHDFFLPRPSVADAGKICWVLRDGEEGFARAHGVDCLIGGEDSHQLTNEPGLHGFFFDGSNYFPLRVGASDGGV